MTQPGIVNPLVVVQYALYSVNLQARSSSPEIVLSRASVVCASIHDTGRWPLQSHAKH